ncbi:MAG: DUF4837 family protein [Bacteroidaceae bacterium]|nr:DUF4837 family protein [Bacteroidaceae bacterium]
MKPLFYSVLLMTTLLLFSCDGSNNGKQGTAKGRSTSQPYELLVVCNKEWLKTDAATTFKTVIDADVPCLPQREPQFRLTKIEPTAFTKSFMFYANIITADINPTKYQKAECGVARDLYARPQLLISLTAPDQASFDDLCNTYRDRILDLFNEAELQRLEGFLSKRFSGIVERQARSQFGVGLHVPEEINAVKTGKDFLWGSSEGQTEQYLNVCLYTVPYTSAEQLTQEAFIVRRDSIMKVNIEGGHKGQYMSTEKRVVQSRYINVAGRTVQEVRGLWAMEGDAMGGPYVSLVQVDSVRSRLLITEGFVYAPDKKKRDLLRKMEAALRTLTLE